MGRSPAWWRVYEALVKKGASKAKAAKIASKRTAKK
jgi:hypothetical protein